MEAADADADSGLTRVRPGVVAAYILLGIAVIAAGWALTQFAGWDEVFEDIAINVGTTVALVGIIVALERRLTAIQAQLDDVAAKLEPARPSSGLRDRAEIRDAYLQAIEARAPAVFVPESDVLERRDAELSEEAAKSPKDWMAALAEGNWEFDDRDEPTPSWVGPSDPLDPCDPLDDWWRSSGPMFSKWRDHWTESRRPYAATELRTRVEMAGLYARTADAATGLVVFHGTAGACEELLAIALDVLILDAPFVRRGSSAVALPAAGRDSLRDHARQIRTDVLPEAVAAVIEEISEAREKSSLYGSRQVRRRSGDDVIWTSWAEEQERLVTRIREARPGPARFVKSTFVQSFALPLVERTDDAIRALRLAGIDPPGVDKGVKIRDLDAGAYVWGR